MKFIHWLFPRCEYSAARALFLRALAFIYLIAIVSWWVQAEALIGKGGLVPVAEYLERAGEYLHVEGRNRIWNLPTLFWINASDPFIHVICAVGSILAVVVIAGFAVGPCLLGLWIVYLSLVTTGNVFMSFQWDILLLEAGALAMLLAPWSVARISWRNPPALGWGERIALWLCWFVIAKLMFQSGWVKLAWATPRQPEWWPDDTAMMFHYMTQPIPTWTAWWMHHLPPWFHKASLAPMYFVELVLPFFVFLGARLRLVAAIGFVLLMILILATGNFTYFNLLTIVLCLPLVADRYWAYLPRAWKHIRTRFPAAEREDQSPGDINPEEPATPDLPAVPKFDEPKEIVSICVRGIPLAVVALLNAIVCLNDWHGVSRRVPDPLLPWTHLKRDLTPDVADRFYFSVVQWHLVSGYGLFRTMTIDRPEILIEGSRDGLEWREYDVRWKPDKLHVRPRFVAPHQPRVAWQFWFAALERRFDQRSRNAPWFSNLMLGLLNNDPKALSFFSANPFSGDPPRQIRARLYLYEFTTPEERKKTGDWWKRRAAGDFLPIITRRQ